MKTYFYALAFSLIAFTTFPSSNLYGQSIATSPAKSDSLREVEEFASHANAILDSLMRFEIAKLRIEQLTGQRVNWSTEKLGLLADNLKLQDKNQKQERAYVELHTLFEKTRSKLTWANVERWAWRVVAIVGAYIFLQKIPPL